MNILEEAQKLANSPLGQRILGINQQSPLAPGPAAAGIENPAAPKDYKPLIMGGIAVVVVVIGLVFALRGKKKG